ncbi:MAG: hypothetical protein DFNUSKGM_000888 [Candidatus Fervidibacter sacchari]
MLAFVAKKSPYPPVLTRAGASSLSRLDFCLTLIEVAGVELA